MWRCADLPLPSLGLFGRAGLTADRLSLANQLVRKTLVLIGEAQEFAPPCWIGLTFRRLPHLCSERQITLRPRQVILHVPNLRLSSPAPAPRPAHGFPAVPALFTGLKTTVR